MQDRQFVAIVFDVESLSTASAAVVHSFIDQLSPYFGSVFIFTMTTPDEPSEAMSRRDQELFAERQLNKIWKEGLHLNQRASLVARITSNAVVVWSPHLKSTNFDPNSVTRHFKAAPSFIRSMFSGFM